VETLFGKMARTFLRHIRVQSWEELRQRILLGIAEINAAPVVHRWKKFDALTPGQSECYLINHVQLRNRPIRPCRGVHH
jgi:hypothetical protein